MRGKNVKITKLVEELQEILGDNGDLEVEVPVLGDTAPVDSLDVYARSNGNDVVILFGES